MQKAAMWHNVVVAAVDCGCDLRPKDDFRPLNATQCYMPSCLHPLLPRLQTASILPHLRFPSFKAKVATVEPAYLGMVKIRQFFTLLTDVPCCLNSCTYIMQDSFFNSLPKMVPCKRDSHLSDFHCTTANIVLIQVLSLLLLFLHSRRNQRRDW